MWFCCQSSSMWGQQFRCVDSCHVHPFCKDLSYEWQTQRLRCGIFADWGDLDRCVRLIQKMGVLQRWSWKVIREICLKLGMATSHGILLSGTWIFHGFLWIGQVLLFALPVSVAFDGLTAVLLPTAAMSWNRRNPSLESMEQNEKLKWSPSEHVENSWSGQHFEFRRILQQWQIPRWSNFGYVADGGTLPMIGENEGCVTPCQVTKLCRW